MTKTQQAKKLQLEINRSVSDVIQAINTGDSKSSLKAIENFNVKLDQLTSLVKD